MVTNNKPKPDDRSDNVEKLQEMVQNTIGNMRKAEETMMLTDDDDNRAKIATKNERRRESIHAMREEISDEAAENNHTDMLNDDQM